MSRIVEWAPYGAHILLECRNHPANRYRTKNIFPIGGRTIYPQFDEPDCACKLADLRPAPPTEWPAETLRAIETQGRLTQQNPVGVMPRDTYLTMMWAIVCGLEADEAEQFAMGRRAPDAETIELPPRPALPDSLANR